MWRELSPVRARHDRTTGWAERASIGIQTYDDPVDVGDIIVAEAIHIGLAGLSLCLRGGGRSGALRQRRN